jgi:glycosyltransferase involved in cell wall biosynthesis
MFEQVNMEEGRKIVVAIPCYNEAVTIERVIRSFRESLPTASVYVFDNNSTDESAQIAANAGAAVVKVRKQGKGNVLQQAFDFFAEDKVDAVVVVDGDDTYDARDVHRLLTPVLTGEADMVVGNRMPGASNDSMRALRQLGNWLIVNSINIMFGTKYHDILSGYRVFSRRFVETVPLLTPGFETETEMTLQALEEGMVIEELPISYRNRPEDSHSKLNAFGDGYRIMLTAAMLLRDHNPLRLFGLVSILLLGTAFILLIAAVASFREQGEVNMILLFIGILLLMPLSALSFSLGLILNAVNTRFRQLKQIFQRNK